MGHKDSQDGSLRPSAMKPELIHGMVGADNARQEEGAVGTGIYM